MPGPKVLLEQLIRTVLQVQAPGAMRLWSLSVRMRPQGLFAYRAETPDKYWQMPTTVVRQIWRQFWKPGKTDYCRQKWSGVVWKTQRDYFFWIGWKLIGCIHVRWHMQESGSEQRRREAKKSENDLKNLFSFSICIWEPKSFGPGFLSRWS